MDVGTLAPIHGRRATMTDQLGYVVRDAYDGDYKQGTVYRELSVLALNALNARFTIGVVAKRGHFTMIRVVDA